MATTDEDQMAEDTNQHHRMAQGAWVDGCTLKESAKATMPEANSDHGNFTQAKGVQKSNA